MKILKYNNIERRESPLRKTNFEKLTLSDSTNADFPYETSYVKRERTSLKPEERANLQF